MSHEIVSRCANLDVTAAPGQEPPGLTTQLVEGQTPISANLRQAGNTSGCFVNPILFVLRVRAHRRRRLHGVSGSAHIVVCEHRKEERL